MVDLFTDSFGSFINELNNITGKGTYGVQPVLNPVKPKNFNLTMPNLPSANYSATGGTGGATGSLAQLMKAIKSQESGGNYQAINKDSGAAGGYQIMPMNLSFGGGSWDRQAIGRSVSRDEFLNNPGIQDSIAKWQLNNYLNKYGAAGAAVAWYGGPGSVKNMHSKTTQAGGYPSLYAYWTSVLDKM